MRSIIGVTLYAAFHICYFLGLEPVASLPAQQLLLISAVFGVYVLLEVSFLTARIRKLKQIDLGKKVVAAPVEAAKPASVEQGQSLIEQERDELRDRLAGDVLEREKFLREKSEAAKKLDALSARIRELESGAEEQGRRHLCHFVSRLQELGRLVDFLMDDVTPYSDSQIGAASRVVHEGCRQALNESLEIAPVYNGREGESVSLDGSAPPGEWRVMGSGSAQGVKTGRVLHRGWKVTQVRLPKLSGAQNVLAPAELELES